MIPRLAAPSVCVIDDEEDDYAPLLDALLRMGVGCVHFRGRSGDALPRKPFRGLRLVFADLHLSGQLGKAAASHTANVFGKVVSAEAGPVVVIIWSKYKDDVPGGIEGIPLDEQPTEAELFKTTVLDSFPLFKERLVFVELAKPHRGSRPRLSRWVRQLQRDIEAKLTSVAAYDALWGWESLVREATIRVTEGLTMLARLPEPVAPGGEPVSRPLSESLKLALRLLVREQAGPICSATAAPSHLACVLGQSLVDHLEHSESPKDFSRHGTWLSDFAGLPKTSAISPGVNGFLLTEAISKVPTPFVPGTVYSLTNPGKFEETFGASPESLLADCYDGAPTKFEEWKVANRPKPVLIEVSPVCDVHQQTRQNALLLGGLIFPAGARKKVKRGDAIESLPNFSLRWEAGDFPRQSAFLMFFSRLKTTLRAAREPRWLVPWFRLRELPTASLRNWHSSHAARVGFVSLQ